MALEERFTDFIRNLQSVEIIDEMQLSLEQRKSKKADFFFFERQFIGEMKSIKKDMEPKAHTILDKHRDRPEYPIFFRQWEVSKILEHLPDGEYINHEMFYAITSALEYNVEQANRQIRETKKTFELEDTEGILIVLNELVENLSPDLIAYRIHQLLNKKSPSGDARYPNISVVWVISDIYVVKTVSGQELLPSVVVVNDHTLSWQSALDYVNWLQRKWASFNNIPFVEGNVDIINSKFSKRKELNYSGTISRSEMWIRQYIKTPYLRHLNKEQLLKHGQHLWYETLPAFIKGSHDKPPQEKVFELMELGTHFIEEINHRGIDFREFLPELHEAVNRLQREGRLDPDNLECL
jgi:hypothetical protein